MWQHLLCGQHPGRGHHAHRPNSSDRGQQVQHLAASLQGSPCSPAPQQRNGSTGTTHVSILAGVNRYNTVSILTGVTTLTGPIAAIGDQQVQHQSASQQGSTGTTYVSLLSGVNRYNMCQHPGRSHHAHRPNSSVRGQQVQHVSAS